MIRKIPINDKEVCFDIEAQEIYEAPIGSGKWRLKITVVSESRVRLGYFPVEEKRLVLGQGTKQEMEALWKSICEKK